MQDLINAAILGVVEGVTEFLPVSSTGHLILANQWFGFESKSFTTLFDIVIQLGAILAVVGIFWGRLFPWGKGKTPELRKNVYHTWGKALVGFIPTGIAAFLLSNWIEARLFTPWTVAITLIFYGIIFIIVEKIPRKSRFDTVEAIGYPLAFLIGAIQILSLVPGTSRSGITIIGALVLGCSRVAAAEFTFFMAIPTMGAATVYSLFKYAKENHFSMSFHEITALVTGFAVSFLVAWVVVRAFMRFVTKHTFIPFGIYRIALGAVVLGFFLVTGASLAK